LHNTRGEHELLEETLQTTAKESRSLKRQLALLEGGTSSALSELARERDEAVEATSEIKRRWETAQKKIRSQEDEADRVQDLWQRDKDTWEDDKRKYERRIHVVEGRLKVVLEEVAMYQASQQSGQQDTDLEEVSRDPVNGHGSDAASVRTMSMTNSIRFSTLNGMHGGGAAKTNGVSLADELDDYESQTDYDGRESVLSLRHQRNQSRESVRSKNHRRNMSIESLMRPSSVARGRMIPNQALVDRLEGGILEDDESSVNPKFDYVDAGVQYSPPASPTPIIAEPCSSTTPVMVSEDASDISEKPSVSGQPAREWEVEANQRRKRVHTIPHVTIDSKITRPMVSAASQTVEESLSAPKSPRSPTRAPPPPPINDRVELVSISTQTDSSTIQPPKRAAPPAPIPIPSIQLHPPSSAPATPKEPLLPQHARDAACQVHIRDPIPTRSKSVQTEEIRVDMRLNLLPPHLQPSAISSSPPSPAPSLEASNRFSPVPGNLPPRNPRRITSPRTSLEHDIPSSPPVLTTTRDAYPGNNDDGPLAKDKGSIRRPLRVSSLFAGFENISSDDGDDSAEGDLSDNDYRTALSAPNPHAASGRNRKPSAPTSVPEFLEKTDSTRHAAGTKNSTSSTSPQDAGAEYTLPEVQNLPQRTPMRTTRQLDKPLTLVTTKPGTMRRAALIQSGVAAHQGQAGSPTVPELAKELPPFPIPTRASSRMPLMTSSAPSDGTRSPTWGRGSGRGHYRAGSIRKVRSAAALPRAGRSNRRHGSRSPPPMSPSTEAPESPQLPPMPNNDLTSPRFMRDAGNNRYRSHRQQPSSTTANTVNTNTTSATNSNSVGSSTQATTVVDAIAQTMVGEWMFKYVRRRKSFGVSEPSVEGDNGNGVRHKRWVWLAPYERAVMWSSRQPTSGSALLGKSGRKRKSTCTMVHCNILTFLSYNSICARRKR